MSNNGAALDLSSTRSASPARPQHRMSRSITDASAPTKQRHGHQHHHLPHLHQRRNQRDRNDRVPQSAVPTLQIPARASLDLPRSEGVTPYMLSSAEQSRRASMLFQGGEDIGTLAMAAAAVREKQLQVERARAASRTAYVTNMMMKIIAVLVDIVANFTAIGGSRSLSPISIHSRPTRCAVSMIHTMLSWKS